jgi:hypothetical protein
MTVPPIDSPVTGARCEITGGAYEKYAADVPMLPAMKCPDTTREAPVPTPTPQSTLEPDVQLDVRHADSPIDTLIVEPKLNPNPVIHTPPVVGPFQP